MSEQPKRQAFLIALSVCGSVSQACIDTDIGRTAVYGWRKTDADFAAQWDEAKELAAEALEDEAHRRAFAGSDTLLIFMLKGARPEKYRERFSTELTGKGGGPVELTDLDRASRVAALLARCGVSSLGRDVEPRALGATAGTADTSAK